MPKNNNSKLNIKINNLKEFKVMEKIKTVNGKEWHILIVISWLNKVISQRKSKKLINI